MRTYEHTIHVDGSLDYCYTIVHSSDAHIGAPNTDEDLLEATVKRIEGDEDCGWIDTGDMCELITRTDPRFEKGEVPEWFDFSMMRDPVKYQVRRYGEIFSPIKDQCLANVYGNHEYGIQKHHDRDVYEDICDSIDLDKERRFGSGGFLRLRFVSSGKVVWRPTIFLHHGTAGGRTKSAIVRQLEYLPKSYDADVYCIGHSHKKVSFTDTRCGMDTVTGKMTLRKIAYSCGASYMIGVTDSGERYNERKCLYPQDRGPTEIRIYPNRKDIKIVI
jgi:hypothetical protein